MHNALASLLSKDAKGWIGRKRGFFSIFPFCRNIVVSSQSKPSGDEQASKPMDAYEISTEKIGEGGYATVYLSYKKADRSKLACKVVAIKPYDAEWEESLRNEVTILMALNHPNIIKIYDYFQHHGNHMIMLECVDGGELFERITKKSHLTEKLAKDYVIDMLSAVKYCHDRKIVHRDLKPENFLMSSQSEYAAVKLIDFGFAVQLEEGGSVSDDCGTPEYMAPEAMMQQPYGTSVDMWALGVITYILLCGYPPFPNGDLQRLIRYVTTGRYVFHSKYWTPVSAEAKDLISKLLVVDPAKRLDVDGAFAHPWLSMEQRLLEGNDLSGSLKRLKRSWAARKWRASIRAVIAVNKMTRLGQRLAEEKVSGSTHEKRKQAQAALADEERKEKERGEGEEAAGDGDDTASEIMYGSDVDELEDQSTRDSGTWSQLTPRFPELVKEEDD